MIEINVGRDRDYPAESVSYVVEDIMGNVAVVVLPKDQPLPKQVVEMAKTVLNLTTKTFIKYRAPNKPSVELWLSLGIAPVSKLPIASPVYQSEVTIAFQTEYGFYCGHKPFTKSSESTTANNKE